MARLDGRTGTSCAASIIKANVRGVPRPSTIERSSPRARSRRTWRACPHAPGPPRARSDRRCYLLVAAPVSRVGAPFNGAKSFYALLT